MGNSVLGLLFEISADPSKAKEALAQFEAETGTSFQNATIATRPFNDSLLSNRESVRLLSEEMGVHLPRAVSGAIAEMMPAIGVLGPALLAAFAIEELPKLIHGIEDAANAIGGFGKEAQKALQDAVAASDEAIVKFKTIKEGIKLRDEVNQNIAALTVQRDVLDQMGGVWINYLRAGVAFLSGNIALSASYAVMAKVQQMDMKALIGLENERLLQLNTETGLEITKGKEEAEAAKRHAEQVKRLREELNRFNQEEIKEGVAAEKRWAHIQAQDQGELEKALKETNKAVDQQGRGFVGMPAIFAPLNAGYQQLTAAQRAALPTLREEQLIYREITKLFPDMEQGEAKLKAQELARNETVRQLVENTKQHKVAQSELNEVIYESISGGKLYGTILDQLRDASIKETDAIKQNTLATIQELSTGLAGLIAGRKAQAAVEAIWETARGIACIAEGTWPPNPAAIMAAAKHFEAAVQYGILGGGGGSQSSTTTTTTQAAMSASQLASLPGLPPGWTYNQYGNAVQMAGGLASPVSGNITVMVVGEAGAAQWMTGVINTGVQKNDVTLAATTSRRPTTVRR